MEIILFRHGKVDHPPVTIISAQAFSRWVQAYNANGLDAESKPPEEAKQRACASSAVVCSELPRSIASVKLLSSQPVTLQHEMFNEAGLPIAGWERIRLSVRIWAILFRVMWLFGYSKNSESFEDAKNRGAQAADMLIELAQEHPSVTFVGHGVFNRIVAKELRLRGWIGPRSPGSNYWDYAVYTNT